MKTPQPHRIESVTPLPDRRLRVAFVDGWATEIDLSMFIREHPALLPLLEADAFSRLAVGEWGFDLTWDNGGDCTIAATALRRLAEEQTGGPAHKFDEWMQNNRLSLSAAADSLGMTRRMIAHYRTGSRPIPKTVLLACKGWEAEQAERSPITGQSHKD
jgi:hypothetical protein